MIERKLFSALVKHPPKKELSIITGPRQSGKTTLMEMLQERLIQKGEKTLYLNLDIEWDRPHFESQQALRNLDLKKSIKIGKTRLTFLPYYALMFKTL